MAGYLKKYVGTYRVLCDFDQCTGDFPRDSNGAIESSFDDYYLCCKNNIKIRHSTGSTLSCYIPSTQRGLDTIRKIFINQCKESLKTKSVNTKEEVGTKIIYEPTKEEVFSNTVTTDEKKSKRNKYNDEIIHRILFEKNILSDIDIMDGEVYIQFKTSLLDVVAKIVGAKTTGASISPLSVKNLPKGKYKIPEEDLKKYSEIIAKLPTQTRPFHGLEKEMVDGLLVKSIITGFDPIMQKSLGKKVDIKTDRKQLGLKNKEYIHSKGLWQEFLEYLQKEVIKYEN